MAGGSVRGTDPLAAVLRLVAGVQRPPGMRPAAARSGITPAGGLLGERRQSRLIPSQRAA